MIIVDNGLGFGEDSVQQIYCDVFWLCAVSF
jgi:hypothetical protein